MGMLETLRSVLRFRRFEWNSTKRRLARAANIDDLRALAKRRLPDGVFAYIDGAAEDEITADRNRSAYRNHEFVPRVLRDVSSVDLSTTILGRRVAAPIVLAPTGFTRIADSQGELAVARAALRAGVPYALSTLGTRSIEEVADVGGPDLWFQVYVWKDRELVADMLRRARERAYTTIIITVDTAVLGRRERDVRKGFELPPKIGLDTILDGVMHPGWTWDFMRAEPIRFANVAGSLDVDGTTAITLADYVSDQFDPALSWEELEWFRERWDGDIVLKGIQSVDDARIAVEHGVNGIALSNHGGRQLDGAPPPFELVGPVRDAIGDGAEVYCDGGIRRGSDIVKALAMGADAAWIGRAYLYGLGAGGEAGVDHALGLLTSGMARTMALAGRPTLGELDRTMLRKRT